MDFSNQSERALKSIHLQKYLKMSLPCGKHICHENIRARIEYHNSQVKINNK